MQVQKFPLVYKGTYKQFLNCPGFLGHIEPGQQIEVEEQGFLELKDREDFEVVSGKPKKINPEPQNSSQESEVQQ